jgi:hypothetical protein
MNYTTTSGRKTSSEVILAAPGALCGVDMQPPTSGQATLYIYDSENSNTSGKLIIAELVCDAGMNGLQHEYFLPATVNRGLYAELTGANASYIVRFTMG